MERTNLPEKIRNFSKQGDGSPEPAVVDQSDASTAKPRRRSREQRSAETRDKLLNGTFRLLLDVGHAGLRSATISQESGVSRGGLLHHFASKEMVIAAVYEWKVQELEDESWRRIDLADDADLIDAIIDDAKQRFFSDTFKVILDILVASSEEEPLAETLKSLAEAERGPARDGWADRLAASGVEPKLAGKVASFLWNSVKGLAIRGLVNDDREHADRVIALARELAKRQCAA